MLEQLSIQQRFRVLLIFSLACFALCGYIVYRTLSEIRVNGPIYDSIMQGQDLVADILPPPEYLLEAYLVTLQMEVAGGDERLSQLATRNELAARWHDLMDVNAGRIASGEAEISDIGWELFHLMLAVASGKKTWAEQWKLHNALVLFNPAPVT